MARFSNRPLARNRCALLLALTVIVTMASATLVAADCSCPGPYTSSPAYGGDGGTPFEDTDEHVKQIKKVTIRAGDLIDAIQIELKTDSGKKNFPSHGGSGGTEESFTLEDGEYIVRIEGRSGTSVDQLTFFTNKGNKFGPYGGCGGSPFHIEGCVVGLYGRSGTNLDQVAFQISQLK